MASSFRVRTEGGFTMDEWVTIWHKSFKRHNPKWKESEMYLNAQFDDIPFFMWEEDELVDEFDFHDELVEFELKKV